MQILGALESLENHKTQLQDGVISPWGLFSATGETLHPWIRESFPLGKRCPNPAPPFPEPWGRLGAGCEGAEGQARLHTRGCWAASSPRLVTLQLTLAANSPPLLGAPSRGSPSPPHPTTSGEIFLPLAGDRLLCIRSGGRRWGRKPPCRELGKQRPSRFPLGRAGSKGRPPFCAWQILHHPLAGPCRNLPVLTCLYVSLGRWTGKHKEDPSSFLHGESFQHIIVRGLFDAWCKMQLNKTT